MGSDVYLSYKKSTAKTHFLAYKPGEYLPFHHVAVLFVNCRCKSN